MVNAMAAEETSDSLRKMAFKVSAKAIAANGKYYARGRLAGLRAAAEQCDYVDSLELAKDGIEPTRARILALIPAEGAREDI